MPARPEGMHMTSRSRVFPVGTHSRVRPHVTSQPAPRHGHGRKRSPLSDPTDYPLIMKGDGYAPGLPVDLAAGKTICFLTRCHPQRPNMQKVCFDSVKNQTCDDYQHFLIQGAMREADAYSAYKNSGFAVEHGLTKPWPIEGRYVMALDDDNMLVDPEFIKDFKALVEKENPDIVFFKGEIKGWGIYPSWARHPVAGEIDWFCYAVKREMWQRYIAEVNARPMASSDWSLIDKCYRNTKSVIWFNRLVTSTQRAPGRSRPETEF